MFVHAINKAGNALSVVCGLKIICFHQTCENNQILETLPGRYSRSFQKGLKMKISVMDCSAGYICSIMSTEEYEVLRAAAFIPVQLYPILKLALTAKVLLLLYMDPMFPAFIAYASALF